MENRKCNKCGNLKPLADFSHLKTGCDGLNPTCRTCKSAIDRIHREANPEKYGVYRAQWRQKNKRSVSDANAIYYRRTHGPESTQKPRDPAAAKAALKKHVAANPYKTRARRLAVQAIKSGRIIKQPCEVCGAVKAQGHHDDYSKPLDLRWLCVIHHGEAHRISRFNDGFEKEWKVSQS